MCVQRMHGTYRCAVSHSDNAVEGYAIAQELIDELGCLDVTWLLVMAMQYESMVEAHACLGKRLDIAYVAWMPLDGLM